MDGWSDFIQLEPLPWRMRDGRLLRSRTGSGTDGLSSPKFVKCDLQSTNSFFPTVSHDAWYRGNIEESFDNGATWTAWTPAQYVKAEADQALRELATDNDVPAAEVNLLFEAVSRFGDAAWTADAAARAALKA